MTSIAIYNLYKDIVRMFSINKKLLILLIMLFFLTSCAGQSEWIGTSRPDLLIREDGEELTSDHFLSDLEYMMWVLENNFPFFTLADWARNVDIYQLASKAREAILESESNKTKRERFVRGYYLDVS